MTRTQKIRTAFFAGWSLVGALLILTAPWWPNVVLGGVVFVTGGLLAMVEVTS